MSAAQKGFESVYLPSSGGAQPLRGKLLTLGASSAGIQLGTGSYHYTVDDGVPQSPGTRPQTWLAKRSSVASSLAVPSDISPPRVLNGGQVVALSSPGVARVSCSGSNVQLNYLSADGTQVVESMLGTDYTPVPLTGALSQSPSELISDSDLGILTHTLNGQSVYDTSAVWRDASSCVRVTLVSKGNRLSVEDCLLPVSVGNQVTPCRTGISALSQMFPLSFTAAGVTTRYDYTDGSITTVAGTTAWVATQPEAGIATVTYRTLHLNGGNAYTGRLVRDGTVSRSFALGTQTPAGFSVVLNSAAVASVAAALMF